MKLTLQATAGRSWACLRGAVLAFLLAAVALPATAGQGPEATASEASAVLDAMMKAPDHEMPGDMLRNAYAVAVLPSVVKAGLLVAGRHGRGVLCVRHDNRWSPPAFVTLSGGSLGLQAGVSSTDVLLIFRSRKGVDSLIHGKFLMGTDIAVAAGPVGRNAQAATDAKLEAEVYAWSRTRGLFAGLSLQGASLHIDHESNREAYGADTSVRMIFDDHVDSVPAAAASFRDRLREYTGR